MPLILTLSLNPTIDVSSEADLVRPTHKTRTENEVFEPGGGGINVARVVCELGAETLAVCLAGGASGILLDQLLADVGLPRRIIPIAGNTRIALMVYERSTGQEYRFIPSGPRINAAEVEACLAAIAESGFDCLVASGSVPAGCEPDILARVGAIAADHEVPFILDSSGSGLAETLGRIPVRLVKPSLNEFQAYVGQTLANPAEVARAARVLVDDGRAEVVAVTLGMDGAVIASRDGAFLVRAPRVETRSAVGAGDSFVGGVTVALLEGRDIEDAALLGTAAGAAAALNPGTGVCRREDILRIYEALSADPEAVTRLIA
ncbi:MAG: 1-phosphofructokinase family hexose kinase [Rhizobiales bacterium]|nr:1-phosphofructokinase family hexose kinase [Hyphomicrobiales bacterium]